MALLPSDTIRDTHLKSLLDTVLETSKQQLILLRTQLARKLHEDTGWMCVWRVRGCPFGAQSIAIAMV